MIRTISPGTVAVLLLAELNHSLFNRNGALRLGAGPHGRPDVVHCGAATWPDIAARLASKPYQQLPCRPAEGGGKSLGIVRSRPLCAPASSARRRIEPTIDGIWGITATLQSHRQPLAKDLPAPSLPARRTLGQS
jgi:hypothetical protein